jgi:hypothetical protein
MHLYIPLKPHSTGHPVGGGYQCGACGLQGLEYGEPHYRSGDGSSSTVCEPAVPAEVTANHPQTAYAGDPITARAAIGPGMGSILERRGDDGVWSAADLGPPVAAPVEDEVAALEEQETTGYDLTTAENPPPTGTFTPVFGSTL